MSLHVNTPYERQAERDLRRKSLRLFGVRNALLFHGVTLPNGGSLSDLLDQADINGLISGEEASMADRVDVVVIGQDDRGATCYVAAEVSLTVGRHDVDRVLKRCEIIGRALRAKVIPVVAGDTIPDVARVYAESRRGRRCGHSATARRRMTAVVAPRPRLGRKYGNVPV